MEDFNINKYLSDTKPNIVLLSGPPTSGKTSFRNRYIPDDYVVISNDEYVESVALEQGKTYTEVWADNIKEATRIARESFIVAAKEKIDIVIDTTNTTVRSRNRLLSQCKKENFNLVCISFDVSLKTLKERAIERGEEKKIPVSAIEDMKERMTVPFTDGNDGEGFDCVIQFYNGELIFEFCENEQ